MNCLWSHWTLIWHAIQAAHFTLGGITPRAANWCLFIR